MPHDYIEDLLNPPYRSEDLQAEIWERLFKEDGIIPSLDDNALRNVAVVGGLIMLDGQLFKADQNTIVNTIRELHNAGIGVHKDSRFDFGAIPLSG